MKKVRLLFRKGQNKPNSIVEYPDSLADWMVSGGYAEPVVEKAPEKAPEKAVEAPAAAPASEAPAPRRGRPRKAAQP